MLTYAKRWILVALLALPLQGAFGALPQPFTVSLVYKSDTVIDLGWTASTNATSYEVYRGSTLIKSGITALRFGDVGLTASTTYTYTVIAKNSEGGVKSSLTVTTLAPLPGAFTASIVSHESTTANLAWTTSANATSYDVYRNGTLRRGGLVVLTLSDSGLTPSTSYTYTVYAKNSAGESKSFVTFTTFPPTPGAFTLSGVAYEASIALSWTASANATSYTLFGDGKNLGTFSSSVLTYNHTGLLPDTYHGYTLNANNEGGSVGVRLDTRTTVPLPGAFTASVVSHESTTVNLAWTTSANATSYDVYRNGTLRRGGLVGLTFSDSGLTPNTSYTYTVYAKNSAGESKSFVTVTTVPPSVGAFTLSGTATQTSVTLNWTASSDATSYTLLGDGVNLGTFGASVLTYTHTGLKPGTNHAYTISARNDGGSRGVSLDIVTAPGSFTLSEGAKSDSTVNLTWTASTGATRYNLFRDSVKLASGATLLSFKDSGLAAASTQTYLVTAENLSGKSTSTLSVTTNPGPFTVTVAKKTKDIVGLVWTVSKGAVSYDVYRGTTLVLGNTTALSFSEAGLTSRTTYTYTVLAKSKAGTLTKAIVTVTTN